MRPLHQERGTPFPRLASALVGAPAWQDAVDEDLSFGAVHVVGVAQDRLVEKRRSAKLVVLAEKTARIWTKIEPSAARTRRIVSKPSVITASPSSSSRSLFRGSRSRNSTAHFPPILAPATSARISQGRYGTATNASTITTKKETR
jgi:hypothetical protein